MADGHTRISLIHLADAIRYGLATERVPFDSGGQHHNGPRRIQVEMDIGRAAKILAWIESTLEKTNV